MESVLVSVAHTSNWICCSLTASSSNHRRAAFSTAPKNRRAIYFAIPKNLGLNERKSLAYSYHRYSKVRQPLCFSLDNDEQLQENVSVPSQGFTKLKGLFSYQWNVPWSWKSTLLTMVACGASFLFTGLLGSAGLFYFENTRGQLMSLDDRAIIIFGNQLLVTLFGLGVIYAFVSPYRPLPKDLFCYELKDPVNLKDGWLLWGVVGTFAATVSVVLAGIAMTALKGDDAQREVDSLMLLVPLIGSSNLSTACLIGVTGILAPLYEETVFRGYLMTSLTKWFPTPSAIFLSAGAFALAHLTLSEFPQLFALGIVLGFAYARTQNLLTPITIHAFWNSGVILFLTFLKLEGYDIKEFLQ